MRGRSIAELDPGRGEGLRLDPYLVSAAFFVPDHSPLAVGPYYVCGMRLLVSGKHKLSDMDAGLSLRNGSVVDLDLLGGIRKDDAPGCAGAARNAHPLGLRSGAGADRDRRFRLSVSIVVDIHGDQPSGRQAIARLKLARGHVHDSQVGQTAVVVDPIVEEPAHVLVRELLERLFEAFGIAVEFGI